MKSALAALRRRQEGKAFDNDRRELYTLTTLRDLAGVRVLVFPRRRLSEVDEALRRRFPAWEADPIRDEREQLALKYSGHCDPVRAEYQVVPMLTGLFWEVEHAAIYKPAPRFKLVVQSLRMRERSAAVLDALKAFEAEFESVVESELDRPDGQSAG